MDFKSLQLNSSLLEALEALDIRVATATQEACLPIALEGRNIVVKAKTGSGKTFAFGIPIANALMNRANELSSSSFALVLCPTRELAQQVADNLRLLFKHFANVKVSALFGGVAIGPQIASLVHAPDIIVGTPGRIMDLVRKGHLDLSNIEKFVLDEADRMLDMGFADQMEYIFRALPNAPQTMLFSATYAQQMESFTQQHLPNASIVSLDNETANLQITQLAYKMHDQRLDYAVSALLSQFQPKSCIVFCMTKKDTQQLYEALASNGIRAQAIHGDLTQWQREQVLIQFTLQTVNVLVATDVAARGLDIPQVDLVINASLAESAEIHTHRIGRTGRSEKQGLAITLFQSNQSTAVERLQEDTQASISIKHAQSLRFHANRVVLPSHECILVDGGKKQKISKGDLLGALTKQAEIVSEDIGKMLVGAEKSYIAIKQRSVKRALTHFREKRVKGKKLKARKLR